LELLDNSLFDVLDFLYKANSITYHPLLFA